MGIYRAAALFNSYPFIEREFYKRFSDPIAAMEEIKQQHPAADRWVVQQEKIRIGQFTREPQYHWENHETLERITP